MRVLMRRVHGSWAMSFVHGPQTTLVPVVPDRGPDGKGRPDTFHWPDRAVEVPPEQLRDEDVVVLQRPHEPRLAEQRLGRRFGRDIPPTSSTTPRTAPRPTRGRPRRYTADMPRASASPPSRCGRSRTSRRRGCTRSSPAAWARRRGPTVMFDDDTPAPLLKRLRPDVWVKGADYTGTILSGDETIRAYEGRSTTRLLSTTKGNAS
ncbi:hypothetical protein E1293_06130 [Actinomadura darangshiensis]|uniref:Uncharacterized protein n=1 Tax=Actinomadura darangshiensis TaxID=705336 RepID=A0A4R5BRP9_9ACTN|nr:hypothetical protein [Actinomadura darangshiensis]TDD88685.1 hypothetical protein E1293_06130 [Actinomadura darangshiensis]